MYFYDATPVGCEWKHMHTFGYIRFGKLINTVLAPFIPVRSNSTFFLKTSGYLRRSHIGILPGAALGFLGWEAEGR